MKKWKKIAIGVGALVVLVGIVTASVQISGKDVVTVQTGKVMKEDLNQVVTASGEIKPLNYVNVGALAFGRLTSIPVREGDRVRKGDVLATIESVQPTADVDAQKALIHTADLDAAASEAGVKSAEAAFRTSQADETRAKAELDRSSLDFQRGQNLFKDGLIPASDFDARKAAYEVAKSSLQQTQARVAQSRAQWDQTQQQQKMAMARITQYKAALNGVADRLDKTTVRAPLDGLVTNLPVHVGEAVVVGIQNAPGSLVMTIADMSTITAEVKVDETDIVNVRLGQPVEVKIDAIPDKVFTAKVTDIGNSAIIRSTGLATSQSTTGSQEAKDFKVVATLDNPPQNIRPGLSTTAKISTSSKTSILAIPIQALTIRQKGDLEDPKAKKTGTAQANEKPAGKKDEEKKELQGVFVVRNQKAEFVAVETGITGVTDIEVVKGLKEGDEIVTGSYRVLRTLRNQAKIKVDNKAPKTEDQKT